ncbi:type II toxin-antitoxin system PemK/MazF family toxin [Streptosporangium sp. DT93]|uniref:type II toxin-antitoxin system PemK/MazF family toxin n=1 Tax=Streptosporangium sp. DT93 TaxID=3393428 RepID=UPI003CED10CC
MKSVIRKGGVYWVSDSSLTLPPNDKRKIKPRRPVLVLSGDATNEDPQWPIVLVAPISTSPAMKTDFCLKLGAGTANLPEKGWVRIVALQPLVKEDIADYVGHLPAAMLAIVEENLFAYMELIS